ERVDFVIVGSGPNGASPHHSCSDRVLRFGDVVVVDIGGTTAAGYCSDSTRTYALGEPPPEFMAQYDVLLTAQQAATKAVAIGVRCEQIDAAARQVLVEAGIGELFIHRTGHGIGLDTHEDPYIVEGNATALAAGMAFSIEPGFYLADTWGARIEDIVVCSDDGVVVCNNRPRELAILAV
ncbi:MAG: M24 family metallopeptidase, partial [Actinomycetes bacterium]